MAFINHINTITASLENPSLENLDLITAYYLGLKAVEGDSERTLRLEEEIKRLHAKKIALKFVDRLITITGGNNLTPATKERIIAENTVWSTLVETNKISGKVEATTRLASVADLINDSTFHEELLTYEAEAHRNIVGALIKRLEPVVQIMAYGLPSIQPSKKNTLKNLYQGNNVGKTFLSIDLRQANWNALHYWDSTLPSWESFLRDYLPNDKRYPHNDLLQELFLNSKNFRQVTLGVALKRHNAVKMIEATQVMLIKQTITPLVKKLGQPFSESNDEAIFAWSQEINSPLEKWLLETIAESKITLTKNKRPREGHTVKIGSLFRVTRFEIKQKTTDECFEISYLDLSNDKQYSLLRCATPEKVEARLLQ